MRKSQSKTKKPRNKNNPPRKATARGRSGAKEDPSDAIGALDALVAADNNSATAIVTMGLHLLRIAKDQGFHPARDRAAAVQAMREFVGQRYDRGGDWAKDRMEIATQIPLALVRNRSFSVEALLQLGRMPRQPRLLILKHGSGSTAAEVEMLHHRVKLKESVSEGLDELRAALGLKPARGRGKGAGAQRLSATSPSRGQAVSLDPGDGPPAGPFAADRRGELLLKVSRKLAIDLVQGKALSPALSRRFTFQHEPDGTLVMRVVLSPESAERRRTSRTMEAADDQKSQAAQAPAAAAVQGPAADRKTKAGAPQQAPAATVAATTPPAAASPAQTTAPPAAAAAPSANSAPAAVVPAAQVPSPRQQESIAHEPGHKPFEPPSRTVPRPALHNQHRLALPVPFPAFSEPPTEADLVMACLIVAIAGFRRFAEQLHRDLEIEEPLSTRLQLRYVAAYHRLSDLYGDIEGLIADFAAETQPIMEQHLQDLQRRDPTRTMEDIYPVCTDPQQTAALPAMDWVVYDTQPPFLLPDATPNERVLLHMLGLMEYIEQALPRWRALYEQEVPQTGSLTCQFLEAVGDLGFYSMRFVPSFDEGAALGRQEEAALRSEEAQRAAGREFAKRYVVTVGDQALPERYVTVGRLADGRHVAVSTARPHLILLIGNGGMGKTHFVRLLSEGSVMGLSGLSEIGEEPARVLDFCSDWTSGQANHAALNGVLPNKNPAAHQRLRDLYGADTSNVAYRVLELFCLPRTAQSYRDLYPDLVERGLQPIEIVFHDKELNHFNLSVLAGLADPKYKTRAHEWFDSMVARYGPDLTLLKLIAELDKSDLESRSKGRIMRQLSPILQMRSETEWMLDKMETPHFKAVILESEWLPMDMLVPVNVAMMNALCRVLHSGKDPLRIYSVDEMLKFLGCPGMMRFLEMLAAELRHRPLTMVLAAQRATGIPRRLVPLATIFGTFHMSNPAEFRRWQAQVGPLSGVSYQERIKTLGKGQVILTGLEGSDPAVMDQGLWVELRDTAIEPGGRTIRTG